MGSEDIDNIILKSKKTKNKNNSYKTAETIIEGLTFIDYKMILFLFVLFIIITSTLFSENILKKISGTFESNGEITSKGVILQALALSASYTIFSGMQHAELI